MLMRSERTGRLYEPKDSVYIVNPKQANLYLKHHVVLLDIIPGDRLAFVFDKRESHELYKLWSVGELT